MQGALGVNGEEKEGNCGEGEEAAQHPLGMDKVSLRQCIQGQTPRPHCPRYAGFDVELPLHVKPIQHPERRTQLYRALCHLATDPAHPARANLTTHHYLRDT